MKTVLCFGDSNTFGYRPDNGMRYDKDTRWTGKLQNLLGSEYNVVEEGCNGRTAVGIDPFEEWKYGMTYLKPCLNSHKPIDTFIIMLGSNDLKGIFFNYVENIAKGVENMVKVVKEFLIKKQGFAPEIILISPPHIGPGIATSPFRDRFTWEAIGKSQEFATYYKIVADKQGCKFIDAAEHIKPSQIDSLHLDAFEHSKLATVIYRTIIEA